MARGGFPGMGGNMQQLARQAQKLQQQMLKKATLVSNVLKSLSNLAISFLNLTPINIILFHNRQ